MICKDLIREYLKYFWTFAAIFFIDFHANFAYHIKLILKNFQNSSNCKYNKLELAIPLSDFQTSLRAKRSQ